MNKTEFIEKYDPLLRTLASKFALLNRNAILEYEDYYQEAVLLSLSIFEKHENKESLQYYLTKSILNHFSEIHNRNNSPVKTTKKIIKDWITISNLDKQNLSDEEIQKIMGLSYNKLFFIRNLLNREVLVEDQELIYDHDNLIVKEIFSFLNEEELQIINLCLNDKNLSQIAKILEKPNETIRIKVINIIQKLRNIYND